MRPHFLSLTAKLWRQRRGVTGIEYALIVALIALAVIGGVKALGTNLAQLSCDVAADVGVIAANDLHDVGSTNPCGPSGPPDTCSGVAAGNHCNRAKNDGSGVDDVIVVIQDTLFAWPSDESAMPHWSSGMSVNTPAFQSTAPGDGGKAMSDAEATSTDSDNPYYAAQACYNHGTSHTAGDWYLPASVQLLSMINENGTGSLSFVSTTNGYWSSTENSSYPNEALSVIYNGSSWVVNTNQFRTHPGIPVRCVRN